MVVEKINERIYLIDTLAYGENKAVACYLIKSNTGYAIVDVGYASTYMNIVKDLNELNISLEEIKYIMPTHVHLDHAGATGHLAKLTKAKIIAHERAYRHLIDPSRLIESTKSIFGEDKLKQFGIPVSVEEDRIEFFKEEMELKLGDLTLRCIYTPGHAPHQMSVLVVEKKALITADAVGTIYPKLGIMIPTTPPPSFEAELAMRTVDKLKQNEVEYLLMPHFGFRSDVERVFDETKLKIREWVEELRKLKNEGLNFEEIESRIKEKVLKESGLSKLPYYAEQSIHISILGILNYLDK